METLKARGVVSASEAESRALHAKARERVEQAAQAALASPWPDAGAVASQVFAED